MLRIMSTQPQNDIKVFRERVLPVFVAIAAIALAVSFIFRILKEGLQGVDVGALLIGAVAATLASLLWAWLMTLCFTLKLSSEGVFGHSVWGIRRFVRWQDIAAVKPFRFLNLRYMRLYPHGGTPPIWITLDLAHKSEFEQELQRLAPPNSPIRRCLG
jgi:hypothetical protein